MEQLDSDLDCIHEMPEGFIFVVLVRVTTLTSVLLIDRCEISACWGQQSQLDLEGPETFLYYRDIAAQYYPRTPKILNPWLTGEHALRYGRKQGLVIAKGRQPIPSGHRIHSPLELELSLVDERRNEFSFKLHAEVSRKLKFEYERRLRQSCRRKAREPLFASKQIDPTPEIDLGGDVDPSFETE